MDFTSTADFKVKRRPSNSTVKKQIDEKSETTKEDTVRNSLSRLKSSNQQDPASQDRKTRRPQRPLTGKKKEQPPSIKTIEPQTTQQPMSVVLNEQQQQSQSAVSSVHHIPSREVVEHVLSHSSRMKEFLAKQSLSEYQASCRLQDPVHLLSLDSFMSKNEIVMSQAESYKKVERFLMFRLESDYEYERQKRTCDDLEKRIQSMIDERLRRLQDQM